MCFVHAVFDWCVGVILVCYVIYVWIGVVCLVVDMVCGGRRLTGKRVGDIVCVLSLLLYCILIVCV